MMHVQPNGRGSRSLIRCGVRAVAVAGVVVAATPAAGQCEDGTLTDPQVATFDQFGAAVALSGPHAAVGALLDDDLGANAGAVYLSIDDGMEWLPTGKVFGSDTLAGDHFGVSLAMDGGVLVVGANLADVTTTDGPATDAGAAYVFTYDGVGWVQAAKLTAADAAAGDQFGLSVAIDGDIILVGAPDHDATLQAGGTLSNAGAAYVYRDTGDGWTQEAKLAAPDAVAVDKFGHAIAVRDGIAMISAHFDDDGGNNAGSVYVFADDGMWSQIDKLTASDAMANDQFGVSVAMGSGLGGGLAAIGAAFKDDLGSNAGGVYVFASAGGTWIEEVLLLADDGDAGDRFGSAVAVEAGRVLAGAPFHDGVGAVYLFGFDEKKNAWVQQAKMTPGSAAADDEAGAAVAGSGDVVLLGAPKHDAAGSNAGAAFTFAGLAGDDCDGNGVADVCEPDCDDNGVPDVCEIDCNANGILDSCDIENGTSSDCNANGIPDACEISIDSDAPGGPFFCTADCDPDVNHNGVPDACDDCNDNGVPDVQDLIDGTEQDCNANGTPDSCDIADGIAEDCDGNSVPDSCDFDSGGVFDCNENKLPDICDIEAGTSEDCNENLVPDDCETLPDLNGNGTPDVCEPDCNDNGFPDFIDISLGVSEDANDNGVPDECEDCNDNGVPDFTEIAKGTALDCNANGLPDECDIAAAKDDDNHDPDCNGNGFPDSCDIADETSPDANGNGIPDECDDDCNDNGVPDFQDILDGVALDCNANGVPDACDVADETTPDCNANGVPDSCDLDSGAADDFNRNGIPDACDPDCNANGFPDFLDILFGASEDVNANGVPDECEDCNANGVLDPEDITDGTSADCNANGVPDECDIASGDSADANGDGVPDECDPDHVPGDLDGDDLVNVADLLVLLGAWGGCPSPPAACPGDLGGGVEGGPDNVVDVADLLVLLGAWTG